MTQNTTPDSDRRTPGRPAGLKARLTRLGLSGQLLVLTILFVMIAEVLIYVPSIANFRLNWLNDRLAAAHTAALVLDAAPSGMVPDSLARQILDSVGARAVAMKMGSQRRLLAVSQMPSTIHHDIDMRDVSWHRAIVDAFRTLLSGDNDVMRVVGPAPKGGDFLEIVLDEAPLRNAMLRFSTNIMLLSLVISAHHGDAGLPRAALPAGAADAPHHREHDAIPRRPGKSSARDRRLRPAGRDRPRRARARRDAARSRLDAAAEEPARCARACGVEDQPRPAQSSDLGAAVLRRACPACPTRGCSASRPS